MGHPFTVIARSGHAGVETILVRPARSQDFVTTCWLRVAKRAILRALVQRSRPS